MPTDEYELLPHEEIQKLRDEVEELKKNPMGNVQESEDLKTAMGKLTRSMHLLIEILTRTNDEMVIEFKRTTISEHFQKISDQNEKIAQALLGMAQLQEHTPISEPAPIEEAMQENIPGMMETTQPQPSGVDAPIQMPTIQPPEPLIQQPTQTTNPLDLPPPEHKKKGLGNMFK